MPRRTSEDRVPLRVTHDSDGGVTVRDPASGIVLSVVATHPRANGPKGLLIEAYRYEGGPLIRQDITRPALSADDPFPAAHPTFGLYVAEVIDLKDATPEQIAESQRWPGEERNSNASGS